MSEYKRKILLGGALAVIIAVGLAGAVMLATPQSGSSTSQNQQSSTSQLLGGNSVLLVQLTDPPIVPAGTTSLNMSYTDISLVVSDPVTTTSTTSSVTTSGSATSTITLTTTKTQSGVMTKPQSISTGQSGIVDLLQLQNVSKTLASANLPSGATIYSVTFTVKNINITVNGVTYPVTLATGSKSLLVTLTKPAALEGTNAMLVDLTPTIVNTTSGYQMIPTSVGIMKTNVGVQEQQIGHEQTVSNQDNQQIHHAMGQVSASLVSLSVSGNITTLEVNVTNSGSANVSLVAIGVHGNFTAQNTACVYGTSSADSTTTTSSSSSVESTSTTSSTTTTSSTSRGDDMNSGHQPQCGGEFGPQELVFFANSTLSPSTTTTNSNCETGTMSPSFGAMGDNSQGNGNHSLELAPGQCVLLKFSGVITSGYHGMVVVPSTLSGQQYIVHVVASDSAQVMLGCTLHVSSTSCTTAQNNSGSNSGGD